MPRYTEAQRRRLVRRFHASNLSLAAFCRRHALSAASLCAWRRRLAEDPPPAPAPVAAPQWRAVELQDQSPPGPDAEGGLQTPATPSRSYWIETQGVRLRVPPGYAPEEVAVLLRLVHALALSQGGAPC